MRQVFALVVALTLFSIAAGAPTHLKFQKAAHPTGVVGAQHHAFFQRATHDVGIHRVAATRRFGSGFASGFASGDASSTSAMSTSDTASTSETASAETASASAETASASAETGSAETTSASSATIASASAMSASTTTSASATTSASTATSTATPTAVPTKMPTAIPTFAPTPAPTPGLDVSVRSYTSKTCDGDLDSTFNPNPISSASERCFKLCRTNSKDVFVCSSGRVICGGDNAGNHTFKYYESNDCSGLENTQADGGSGVRISNGVCAKDVRVIGAATTVSYPLKITCSLSSTPAPTPAAIAIKQEVTFSSISTPNDYNSNADMKSVFEAGYGQSIGIVKTLNPLVYHTGCAVASTATTARRSVKVAFSATVAAAQAKVAEETSKTLQPANLVSAINTANDVLKSSGQVTTTVAVPTTSDVVVAAPTVTVTTSTSSSAGMLYIIIIVIVCAVVFLVAAAGGVYYCVTSGGGGQAPQTVTVQQETVEMSPADKPPPGATYMKNGVWIDKNGKPIARQV